jgi:hypothetical protein
MFLHLSHNSTSEPYEKVRPFIEYVSARWRQLYNPSTHLCIDESIVAYRGRCKYVQYTPNKPSRYGIKLFCLSESSGYILDIYFYKGKEDEDDITLVVVKTFLMFISEIEKELDKK